MCSLSVLPTLRLASKGALNATKCINQQHLNIWEQGRLCRALLPTSELQRSPTIGGGALEILHAHTHKKKSTKSQIFVLSHCPKEASSSRKQSCPGTKKIRGREWGGCAPWSHFADWEVLVPKVLAFWPLWGCLENAG